MPLVFREQSRDRSHGHVDVVRSSAAGKCLQLIENIIRVLRRQRRRSRTIRHRTMARLARRNPALSISKRNQPRCDRGMTMIRRRLRKTAIILRILKHWQLRIVRHYIRHIAQRKRLRDRLHHRRRPLVTSKICQLLPGHQPVHARKVRSRGSRAKTLCSVAVLAPSGQQHSPKRVPG